mmetsp:Transcript_9278/g.18091  ORF Transcript_9278/g.18091 Transcript_9278/m.18091 type:complete len:266 (-) Transcript_9278:386-1183(-)
MTRVGGWQVSTASRGEDGAFSAFKKRKIDMWLSAEYNLGNLVSDEQKRARAHERLREDFEKAKDSLTMILGGSAKDFIVVLGPDIVTAAKIASAVSSKIPPGILRIMMEYSREFVEVKIYKYNDMRYPELDGCEMITVPLDAKIVKETHSVVQPNVFAGFVPELKHKWSRPSCYLIRGPPSPSLSDCQIVARLGNNIKTCELELQEGMSIVWSLTVNPNHEEVLFVMACTGCNARQAARALEATQNRPGSAVFSAVDALDAGEVW